MRAWGSDPGTPTPSWTCGMCRASGELGLEPAVAQQQSQQKPWGWITEGMVDRTLGTLWCSVLVASKDDTILWCHINAVVI